MPSGVIADLHSTRGLSSDSSLFDLSAVPHANQSSARLILTAGICSAAALRFRLSGTRRNKNKALQRWEALTGVIERL